MNVSSMPAVVLREVGEQDLSKLFELRRNKCLQSLLLTVPDATDDLSLLTWVRRRQNDPGGTFRIIEEKSTREAIGYAQITQVHRRNRTGYSGIALAPSARGRGLGQATLHQLIELSRAEMGFAKLLAEVRCDNFLSLRLHLSVGFRIVGHLHRHFVDHDHVVHDVILLERIMDGV